MSVAAPQARACFSHCMSFAEVLAQLVLDHREEGDVKTLRHWLEFWQILIAAFLKPFPLSSRSRALDGLLKRMVAVVKTLRDLVKVKQVLFLARLSHFYNIQQSEVCECVAC